MGTITCSGIISRESEYSDDYSITLVMDCHWGHENREYWICAGVPEYLRGTADAAGTTAGVERVYYFGDEPQFNPDWDHGELLAACEDVAMAAWHEWQGREQREADRLEAIEKLEDAIVYARTVDAKLGTDDATGLMRTEYRDIRVSASDLGYDREEHDLTDAEQYAWWDRRVTLEGRFGAMEAEHLAEQLDAIAAACDYADWDDAKQSMSQMDDDGIMDTQEALLAKQDAI